MKEKDQNNKEIKFTLVCNERISSMREENRKLWVLCDTITSLLQQNDIIQTLNENISLLQKGNDGIISEIRGLNEERKTHSTLIAMLKKENDSVPATKEKNLVCVN